MLNINILSVWSYLLGQADNFFLPCPFKVLTGLDCPGCGFQRSFVALLKGQWQESFHLYPATVPLLLTFIIVLPANYFTRKDLSLLIKVLYLITGTIILTSYLYKMFYGDIH
ncbi:DUF2752 domain-containing protein [Pedobacter nyackensis]|uniref:DUF2752 domain-containing protein n=1 Tax=Pedobacter nyackensis TaxID=475255 RepID=UPI00293086E8|nr:DUF2752 domain-containing protein [Pedobacter nyackensis]